MCIVVTSCVLVLYLYWIYIRFVLVFCLNCIGVVSPSGVLAQMWYCVLGISLFLAPWLPLSGCAEQRCVEKEPLSLALHTLADQPALPLPTNEYNW